MKSIFTTTLLLLALWTNAQNGNYLQTIKGTTFDEQSGHPLGKVVLTLEDKNNFLTVTADDNGNFKFNNVSIGRKTIKATLIGYDDAVVNNIEVTSSKEVIIEIRLKEKVGTLNEVVVKSNSLKNAALNKVAVVSARQLSVDEAVRYAGSRNDPSRMAQNFAGVSGSNDARNDIVIRGNSPTGVLWRMEGIDIPNPNHYSTLGATGGPVTILNTNNLKNSDFITSAFPAQYGNAISGVFDLRMREGNSEKSEFMGQVGLNGFEIGAEGPISKKAKSSYVFNYRYSVNSTFQKLGIDLGTGAAVPYYQDLNFKVNLPTAKLGTFALFGIGGLSDIKFDALDTDNLYSTNDGSLRDRKFNSDMGMVGISNQYFFSKNTSGKLTLAGSFTESKYTETFFNVNPGSTAFYKKNTVTKYSVGYVFTSKLSAKNLFTAGIMDEYSQINLRNDYIPDGTKDLFTFIDSKNSAQLIKSFANFNHRFTNRFSTNLGLYHQVFTLNSKQSFEPRWNIKYQLEPNQSLAFGLGVHSQTQPLEVYFYQSKNANGETELTNKDLDFVKSYHAVLGYDLSIAKNLRLKTEVYGQLINNAAVERTSSSFSMLNSGADFYFPDKTNLINNGKGYNYGLELTLEHFLDKGFYYLITGSLFDSKYKGSDEVWRNTAFNSNFTTNFLIGKEYKIKDKQFFGIDSKLAYAGGQRYTPFDIPGSAAAGYVIYQTDKAYSLQNNNYFRLDIKFTYTRNGAKTTQKWYLDLQNFTNHKNLYVRTLNPTNQTTGETYQVGFFPNFNYKITF